MSKKRVHELGKQLKEHGIDLSNPELVEKLHALGYTDVKSHSSSLEDDQAVSAFEKIIGERKPKPAPAKPTGPGFVVRKRAHVEPVAPPTAAPAFHAAVPDAPAATPPVADETPAAVTYDTTEPISATVASTPGEAAVSDVDVAPPAPAEPVAQPS